MRYSSVCDEPTSDSSSSSANQEKIYEKISKLNNILNELFQKWANNLSQLRELSVAIIQICYSSRSTPSDQLHTKVSQILLTFQTGAIIHCGLSIHSFLFGIKFSIFLKI